MKRKLNVLGDFTKACLDALRDGGGRVTGARLAIIECIANTKLPLTAKELYENLQDKTKVDQVSVYRTLETLLELDLIHQVFPSGGYIPCFHLSCEQSYHILTRCSQCNSIEEMHIPVDKVEPLINFLKSKKKFYPDTHLIQINGVCSDCKK